MQAIENLPAFGICGWSGSGKTTVIEEVVRRLTARNLKVAVIKHDVHGLNIDHEGKDSDRFFKAGADVIMRGPKQSFLRAHRTGDSDLHEVLKLLCPYYDLILVEGHKSTPLFNKVWVLKEGNEKCPPEATNIKRVLGLDENRVDIVTEMIDSWFPKAWLATPVYAGILIGGNGERMGSPKRLVKTADKTWLERTAEIVQSLVHQVVVLGRGEIPGSLRELPVLTDVQDVEGPLAGMLSAMRWRPFVSWLFLACDLPLLSAKAAEWLLSTRVPGVWATMPKLQGGRNLEPLLAHYDFRSHHLLEDGSRPADIASSPKVITPTPPSDIADAWTNINTPADLGSLTRRQIDSADV